MARCRSAFVFALVLFWSGMPALAGPPTRDLTSAERDCRRKMVGDCHMGPEHHPRPRLCGIARDRLSLPRQDIVVTHCGICLGRKKINFSTVFAGQAVGIKEVHNDIWLVSFTDYDLRYFDLDTRVLESLDNPFGPPLLPTTFGLSDCAAAFHQQSGRERNRQWVEKLHFLQNRQNLRIE
jgi:hypothetical protein